jgi:hypothetical protein
MNRAEVITHMCSLIDQVGIKIFKSQEPHDCICDYQNKIFDPDLNVSEKVVQYIVDAVYSKIQKDLCESEN